MIVSYKHNFVFVKTRKTAGTSMEIALSSHAGDRDVITPLGNPDELMRSDLYPDALPRNYLADPALEENYKVAVRARDTAEMARLRKGDMANFYLFHNHSSADHATKRLDRRTWDSMFKFTIERHPYEKAVSWAWHRKGKREVRDALDYSVEKGYYRNFGLYTIDGVIAVDFIVRYENMLDDLKQVEKRLGLDIISRLPRAKGKEREDRRPAKEVLSATQKAAIRKRCAEEFALMGYAE